MYLSETMEEIGATTFLLEPQNALRSCFQTGSFLPNGRFAPGYLYRCIEEIFKPLVFQPSPFTQPDWSLVSPNGTKASSQNTHM
jgi:hypothetical protein